MVKFNETDFGMTQQQARRAGICVRCKQQINPDLLDQYELREYVLSAVCPTCFDALCHDDNNAS